MFVSGQWVVVQIEFWIKVGPIRDPNMFFFANTFCLNSFIFQIFISIAFILCVFVESYLRQSFLWFHLSDGERPIPMCAHFSNLTACDVCNNRKRKLKCKYSAKNRTMNRGEAERSIQWNMILSLPSFLDLLFQFCIDFTSGIDWAVSIQFYHLIIFSFSLNRYYTFRSVL